MEAKHHFIKYWESFQSPLMQSFPKIGMEISLLSFSLPLTIKTAKSSKQTLASPLNSVVAE